VAVASTLRGSYALTVATFQRFRAAFLSFSAQIPEHRFRLDAPHPRIRARDVSFAYSEPSPASTWPLAANGVAVRTEGPADASDHSRCLWGSELFASRAGYATIGVISRCAGPYRHYLTRIAESATARFACDKDHHHSCYDLMGFLMQQRGPSQPLRDNN